MEATHTLDGKPIIRMQDKVGSVYYVGMNKIRVGTKGREADIQSIVVEELQDVFESLPRDEPDNEQSALTAFPFDAVMVAMGAMLAGHGYAERGRYCANRCGERSAILSLPAREGGGSTRYLVEFPETMVLTAAAER